MFPASNIADIFLFLSLRYFAFPVPQCFSPSTMFVCEQHFSQPPVVNWLQIITAIWLQLSQPALSAGTYRGRTCQAEVLNCLCGKLQGQWWSECSRINPRGLITLTFRKIEFKQKCPNFLLHYVKKLKDTLFILRLQNGFLSTVTETLMN